jgi:hypothetical protein
VVYEPELPWAPPDPSLEERWLEYHRRNPGIYRAFCRFADEALRAGRKRLGAKMLFERIRWYTTVEARDRSDGFKLNNNYHAFYARLWLREHPEHPDFFETRKQRTS